MREAFQVFKQVSSRSSHGEVAKHSRWWSFESKGAEFRRMKAITLYVCIYIGYKRRWWLHLEQTPLIHHDLVGAPDPDVDAPMPGEDEEPQDEEA